MRFSLDSLKSRLLVWFLVLSLVPTVTVSLLAVTNSRRSMQDSYLSTLDTYSTSQADAISKWIEENTNQIKLIASAPEIINGVKNRDSSAIISRLKEYVKINPAWEILFWTDASGNYETTLDAKGNVGDREYFRQAMSTGQPAVSNGIISKSTGRPIFTIAVPVIIDGKPQGIVAATVTLDYLANMCKDSKLGKEGYGFIIQNDGLALAFPDESLILKQNFLQTDSESFNSMVRKMVSGEKGVDRVIYNGVPQLVAYAPIDGTTWSFGVQEPESTAFAASNYLIRFIVIILLIATAVVLFISYMVGNSLVNPILELVKVADTIASGDLTVSIETDYRGEIGRLADSLKTMLENFKNGIVAMSNVVAQTNSISSQVSTAAEQTSTAVQQVSTTVQGVAGGAQETAKNVTDASSAVDNISRMIEELAQNSAVVDKTSQETLRLTEEGQKVVDELRRGFNQTSEATNSIVNVMSELERAAGEIGRIVETITSISSQTNLLALNAAIEAARAGEAGRGFAVVADEVRKLAEESNKSAQQISQFIDEIRNQITRAAENTGNAVGIISKQVEIGSRVTETFDTIQESNNRIIEMIGGITSSISKLVDEGSKISTAVQGVAAIAEENAASAEEVSAAVEEITATIEEITANIQTLAGQARELEDIVRRFKV